MSRGALLSGDKSAPIENDDKHLLLSADKSVILESEGNQIE